MPTPFRIAITGSIGMGKSTVSGFFRTSDVPVWDADDTVRRLYQPNGAGTAALKSIAPNAITENGVDRARLSAEISASRGLLDQIESVIHPLVAADRSEFEKNTTNDLVAFDIPLLFETDQAESYDYVVVVSAAAMDQRTRVLARPGMTPEKFEMILARQTPDAEKRQRADHVIDTSVPLDDTRKAVERLVETLREQARDAGNRP